MGAIAKDPLRYTNYAYIYIYAQRERPFCHPHGQKVGQGCGEALFTEDTTLTRGWIGR